MSEMLFRALKVLSNPDDFEVICAMLDGEPVMNAQDYSRFATADLVIRKGLEPRSQKFYVTKFGELLVDKILEANGE